MADSQIQYKLDLIVRLVDTTTGLPVTEKQVVFRENGRVLALLARGDGTYILLNHGRADTGLEVSVVSYETAKVKVAYESLDGSYPAVTIPLIPVPAKSGYIEILTLEGKLPGIEALDAVDLGSPLARILDYQEKKGILRLLEGKTLEEETYALVHEGPPFSFEEFGIAKRPDKKILRLKENLQPGWAAREAVTRIIRGAVNPDGSYLLRVRPTGRRAEYLIRYAADGAVRFKRIDFYAAEERRLD